MLAALSPRGWGDFGNRNERLLVRGCPAGYCCENIAFSCHSCLAWWPGTLPQFLHAGCGQFPAMSAHIPWFSVTGPVCLQWPFLCGLCGSLQSLSGEVTGPLLCSAGATRPLLLKSWGRVAVFNPPTEWPAVGPPAGPHTAWWVLHLSWSQDRGGTSGSGICCVVQACPQAWCAAAWSCMGTH